MNSRLTGARQTPTDAAIVRSAAKEAFFHAAKGSKTRLVRSAYGAANCGVMADPSACSERYYIVASGRAWCQRFAVVTGDGTGGESISAMTFSRQGGQIPCENSASVWSVM